GFPPTSPHRSRGRRGDRGVPMPATRGRSSCTRGRRSRRRRRGRRNARSSWSLLEMAAELEAHGGEQAVLELRLAGRAEAFEERGGEDVRRHALVDRRVERPSPLAGVGDPAGEALEARIARQRGGGEIEQPRGDDAAAAPHLGDVGEVRSYW